MTWRSAVGRFLRSLGPIVVLGLVAPSFASADIGYLGTFTSSGSVTGEATSPRALAFGPDRSLYVAERDRVLKFASGGSLITTWGSFGNAPGRFDLIADVDTDSDGYVYVSERSNHRVQKFAPDGSFVTAWGGLGHDPGEFYYAADLATDAAGNVYVGDWLNHRIQKFSPDGALLTQWGTEGGGPGELERPGALDTDAAGNVYVADTDNRRIQKFTSDGAYITEWGSSSSGYYPQDGAFGDITALHVGDDGTVYVADTDGPGQGPTYSRIQRFSSDGTFIDEFGCYGPDEANFNIVTAIATDADASIFVADASNDNFYEGEPDPARNRVMVFGEHGTPPPCVAEVYAYEDQYFSNMSIVVSCLRADCVVEASGSVRLGKRRFRIKPVARSLGKEQRGEIEIRVRKRAERRLGRALIGRRNKEKRARAQIRALITDGEGNSETNTLRFLVSG
jgi:DNA-binding beta-propeller fold protein YncE